MLTSAESNDLPRLLDFDMLVLQRIIACVENKVDVRATCKQLLDVSNEVVSALHVKIDTCSDAEDECRRMVALFGRTPQLTELRLLMTHPSKNIRSDQFRFADVFAALGGLAKLK